MSNSLDLDQADILSGLIWVQTVCKGYQQTTKVAPSGYRVATVREKVLENEKISRSGKSQGITFQSGKFKKIMKKVMEKSGNFKIFLKRC